MIPARDTTKNDSMASMTRYSYLALQPYARSETGGVCQVELAEEDFSAVGTNAAARNAISKLKPFKPSATPMPKVYPHPKDIREKWRPAGFAANRKAAAAMALVLWDQPHWNRIGGAWTGRGFLDLRLGYDMIWLVVAASFALLLEHTVWCTHPNSFLNS